MSEILLPCDHQSVGVILSHGEKVALINRANFPYGIAAPAGHIDNHGSPLEAAVAEVYEEIGLLIPPKDLTMAFYQRRMDNECRRGGEFHYWTVFFGSVEKHWRLHPSRRETLGANWFSRREMQEIADRTHREADWRMPDDHVFEDVWLQFLVELNYVEDPSARVR